MAKNTKSSVKLMDKSIDVVEMLSQAKDLGATSGMSQIADAFAPMIAMNLKALIDEVGELNASAEADLNLMTYYSNIESDWNDLLRRMEAAKIAYDKIVKPLIDQLEDVREKAKAFPKWLTFEKSQEISATLFRLKDRNTFLSTIPELEAERKAMLPAYEESREFFALNEQRKNARKANVVPVTSNVKK